VKAVLVRKESELFPQSAFYPAKILVLPVRITARAEGGIPAFCLPHFLYKRRAQDFSFALKRKKPFQASPPKRAFSLPFLPVSSGGSGSER
jgi:hypothetical protein